MPGYALIMLNEYDLCTAISNPSDYVVVGEIDRNNRALKVTAQQPNENTTTIKTEVDPVEKKVPIRWSPPCRPTTPLSRSHMPSMTREKTAATRSVTQRHGDCFL